MATSLPPSDTELDGLETLCRRATPGPWASTTGCGASVHVGLVCIDRPGHTALGKGGFNLFEIDPNVYARCSPGDDESDDAEETEEEFEAQAEADVRYIAAMSPLNTLRLIAHIRELRRQLAAAQSPKPAGVVETKTHPLLSYEEIIRLCRAATGGARELEFNGCIRLQSNDLLCHGDDHDVTWLTPADAEFTTRMSPYQIACLAQEAESATRRGNAYCAMLREHGIDPNKALKLG